MNTTWLFGYLVKLIVDCMTAKAASMVSATMGKARILGLDKQVIEHTGTNGTPLQLPTFNIVGVVPKNES